MQKSGYLMTRLILKGLKCMYAAAHMLLLYSTAIGTPGKTLGTMFTPVKVDITSYEPEKVGGK